MKDLASLFDHTAPKSKIIFFFKLKNYNNEQVVLYQSDESKAFSFVDEDLRWLSIFCKHLPENFLCDVTRQVTNKQTAPLSVGLLSRLQQHGQRSCKTLP